ncbi:hypothetical protein GCM10023084_80230 [Streptomyces lacrimifluminis]|uniref:Uncharacterized protein n=1 Tax=Streptomyces lacrimifluminis TaxID=1500077 RepID=A0A917PCG3_9ACTN|nr:hypothetical protein GCM10012282_79620 [Streptomyces lacrimifluminis]
MRGAMIAVHPPSRTVGRRVIVRCEGRDEMFGTACSDHDLVVFSKGAGPQVPGCLA